LGYVHFNCNRTECGNSFLGKPGNIGRQTILLSLPDVFPLLHLASKHHRQPRQHSSATSYSSSLSFPLPDVVRSASQASSSSLSCRLAVVYVSSKYRICNSNRAKLNWHANMSTSKLMEPVGWEEEPGVNRCIGWRTGMQRRGVSAKGDGGGDDVVRIGSASRTGV
jgi:hypothetical protein